MTLHLVLFVAILLKMKVLAFMSETACCLQASTLIDIRLVEHSRSTALVLLHYALHAAFHVQSTLSLAQRAILKCLWCLLCTMAGSLA